LRSFSPRQIYSDAPGSSDVAKKIALFLAVAEYSPVIAPYIWGASHPANFRMRWNPLRIASPRKGALGYNRAEGQAKRWGASAKKS
jgi:hypothetical protein